MTMFKKSLPVMNFLYRSLSSLTKPKIVDWTKQEKILMQPLEYIRKVPWKYFELLAPGFNHWMQIPEEKYEAIREIMHSFMSWIILSDDIQDDSEFRYGLPASHRVYGVPLTMTAVNKALLLTVKQAEQLGHPAAVKIVLKRVDENIFGQGVDILWRENFTYPTEEVYMEMNKIKSSSFVYPVELMELFSRDGKNYSELALNIGMYYHLLDDYYNLFQPKALERLASEVQENHVSCSDITECKITLPIIHASQFPDVAGELADILKQRTSDPQLVNRAISLLKKHGSDEYMRDMLKKMQSNIRSEINRLGDNPKMIKYMDELYFE